MDFKKKMKQPLYIAVSCIAAGLILLGHHTLALPFAWFVCGMTLLYWFCRIIIQKKY